jgi:hypothetical protein
MAFIGNPVVFAATVSCAAIIAGSTARMTKNQQKRKRTERKLAKNTAKQTEQFE